MAGRVILRISHSLVGDVTVSREAISFHSILKLGNLTFYTIREFKSGWNIFKKRKL